MSLVPVLSNVELGAKKAKGVSDGRDASGRRRKDVGECDSPEDTALGVQRSGLRNVDDVLEGLSSSIVPHRDCPVIS